jgi:hypothetical protein
MPWLSRGQVPFLLIFESRVRDIAQPSFMEDAKKSAVDYANVSLLPNHAP